MLYLGVHFSRHYINIIALSEGFAIMGEQAFHFTRASQLLKWINSLKEYSNENAKWFLDENDFYNPDYPTDLFHFSDEYNTVVLVNHRALYDMMLFMKEATLQNKISNHIYQASFFLASSIRIFHQNSLKLLNHEQINC